MKSGLVLLVFLLAIQGQVFAQPLSGEAYQLAEQAYESVAAGDLDHAMASVQAALHLQPDHPQLLALLAQIQDQRNDIEAARETLDRALQIEPENGRLLAQRGYLYIRLGKPDDAIPDFHHALQTNQLSTEESLNVALSLADLHARTEQYKEAARVLAPYVTPDNRQVTAKWQSYLIYEGNLPPDGTLIESADVNYALVNKAYEALRNGDDARALQLFQIAERYGGLTALQYGDAGYAARADFNNKEADRLFRAAIDVNNSELEDLQPYAPRELYGLRRAVDDLNRYWGFIFSNSITPGGQNIPGTVGLPGSPGGTTTGDINQIGAEIYFQPPVIGYRDGRQLQFFLRSFHTLDDQIGGAEGMDTNQGSLGVRWKPLRDYNLVLTAERLFSIGSFSTDDWLLRAGFSIDQGVDIQPFLTHWPYFTLFAEAAYFIDEARNFNTMEMRWGHSFMLPVLKNLVFTPHLVLAADMDSAAREEFAAGFGAGASLRWWFRESVHRAPASYIDFNVQYRAGLSNDDVRQDGTFLRFTLWY